MTTENYLSWIKKNTVDYDKKEYLNYEQIDDDLRTIRKSIDDDAPADKRSGALKGYDAIRKNFIRPELKEEVEEVNEEKVSDIERTESRSELELISVSEYLPKTIQVKRQKASSFAVIEREEERKEIFFRDPLSAIQLRGSQKWSAVQSQYELTDEELQRLKDELGEDLLR